MPTQVVFNDRRKYRPVHLNALAADAQEADAQEADAQEAEKSAPAPSGDPQPDPATQPASEVQVQTPNGKTTSVPTPAPEDQEGATTTWAVPTNYLYIGGGVLGLLLLMKMLKK